MFYKTPPNLHSLYAGADPVRDIVLPLALCCSERGTSCLLSVLAEESMLGSLEIELRELETDGTVGFLSTALPT